MVKKPSLSEFFVLLPQELELDQELAELYKANFNQAGHDLLKTCADNPKDLI